MICNYVQVGIVSYCNANCYLCNRQTIPDFPRTAMPIETFKKIVPYANRIELVGGFGDFINHPKSLDFIKEVGDKGFKVETNAGIQDESYWKELAELARTEDQYVQFSIDEILRPVNPYRGTNTETVIRNLKTFIDAGGYAKVKTLRFRFNSDAVPIMSKRFKDMGVKEFYTQPSFSYTDEGELSPPTDEKTPKGGSINLLYSLNPNIKKKPKHCAWKEMDKLFVLENGEVHRCCHFQIFAYHWLDKLPEYIDKYPHKDVYNDVYDLYLKNRELINLNTEGVTLESAFNNEYTQHINNNFMDIDNCIRKCSLDYRIYGKISGMRRIF